MKINLRDILQAGQIYVAELSEELGLDVKVVKHNIATNTCFEKADLLGWESNRVVKAIFFGGEGNLYGLVCPELGTREKPLYFKKIHLGKILGRTKKQMKNFYNSFCPDGMEHGTCTPFVSENLFEDDGFTLPLEKIFIHDIPKLNNELVDISIGGYGKDAHKVSLHIPYEDIYNVLDYKFGDRIKKVDFFKNV